MQLNYNSSDVSKNLFSWSLYDAANSFIEAAIGSMFLAQWVVLDNGYDDIWYGVTFTLATVFTLLTSPFWGAWSDKLGRRIPFIKSLTILLILSTGLLAFSINSYLAAQTRVFLALTIAFFVQYFYQLSLIFYNALLEKLTEEGNLGKISGIGQAFNNFGWIVAVAILLPFAEGKITLVGNPGRTQVFLPAFVLFTLLSLPIIFWFKENETIKGKKKIIGFREIYDKTIASFWELIKRNKNATIFLIAFSFISDAILTISLYFAIFMDQVYKISDTQKFYILGLMTISMVIGGYIFGKLSDRCGTKLITLISCINLIFIFSLAAISSWLPVLYLLAFFGGAGWGTFYVTTRALLIKISPVSQLGEYFGFYSTFQRFASIVGPLFWGLTTLILKDYGATKYRVAVLVLVFLMLIGTLMIAKVREQKEIS